MPIIRDFYTQTSELLAQQSATKKVLAACILLAVVIFGITQLFRYGRTVDYEVLYAGLDAQSAKSLTDALKTNAPGVPYTVSQDAKGWTIKTPAGRVLDLRLDLAPSVDVGSGRVGWELFDKSSIGVTDFTQKINRQRAIQGELARTIQAIDVVKTANVTLAIPESSLFVREEAQPKASVLVELYPKAVLSRSKVGAIQALVAGSIEGLTRDNVTVVDSSGALLSAPKGEGEDRQTDLNERAQLVEQQEKQRKDYERRLEEKIESALSTVFGPKHVTAQVNVDFDFTTKEVNELKYNPRNVPVAESLSKSISGKQSVGAEGVVGSTTHLQQEGTTSGSAVARSAEPMGSEEKVTNYQVGKTETKTVFPPFQIRRITAGVMVDDKPVEERDDKGNVTKKTRQKLTEEELLALEEQVKQVISFSEERPGGQADVVKVTNMTFRVPEELTPEETVTKIQTHRLIITAIKYGLLALGVLLFAIFFVRPLMNIVAPRSLTPTGLGASGRAALGGPAGGPPLLEGQGMLAAGGMAGALPQPGVVDEVTRRQSALDKEILELAKENPKKVSLVLRSWIES